MRVTFDTNVWNRMVLPERWPSVANRTALLKLKEAVRIGKIEGFICESFATTEAIRPSERAAYRANSIPIIKTEDKAVGQNLVHMSIRIETNHSLHPGLTVEFEEELAEAIAIGIKLLPTPYIGVPIPHGLRNNLQLYAANIFATSDYNERFGEAVRSINDRGVGNGTLVALGNEIKGLFAAAGKKVEINDRELIKRVYDATRAAGDKKSMARIEKAFAEDADGDMMAAHIAFGNAYLCSEDHGKSAVGASIMDADNRAWLNTTYGTHFLNAEQLADMI